MKAIHRRLSKRIRLPHEAIFVLFVLALLLTVYFHGKPGQGPAAAGNGANRGVVLHDGAAGESSPAGHSADAQRLWSALQSVLALAETDSGMEDDGDALTRDVIADLRDPAAGNPGDGPPTGNILALLNRSELDAFLVNETGMGEATDGNSPGAPSSESWDALLTSLSYPAPQGYGRGGGMGRNPAVEGGKPGPEGPLQSSPGLPGGVIGPLAGAGGGFPGTPSDSGNQGGPVTGPASDPENPPGPVNPVPEPSILLLLFLGLTGIGAVRLRSI